MTCLGLSGGQGELPVGPEVGASHKGHEEPSVGPHFDTLPVSPLLLVTPSSASPVPTGWPWALWQGAPQQGALFMVMKDSGYR